MAVPRTDTAGPRNGCGPGGCAPVVTCRILERDRYLATSDSLGSVERGRGDAVSRVLKSGRETMRTCCGSGVGGSNRCVIAACLVAVTRLATAAHRATIQPALAYDFDERLCVVAGAAAIQRFGIVT